MDDQIKAVAGHIRSLDRKIKRLETALEDIANVLEDTASMYGKLSPQDRQIASILRKAWQVRTYPATKLPKTPPKP